MVHYSLLFSRETFDCSSKRAKLFFFQTNPVFKDLNDGRNNEHDCESSDEESMLSKDSKAVDLEDMGDLLKKGFEITSETGGGKGNGGEVVKEMLTPLIRESLSKQGYKLIG